jgi:hypothetical protein
MDASYHLASSIDFHLIEGLVGIFEIKKHGGSGEIEKPFCTAFQLPGNPRKLLICAWQSIVNLSK